MMAADRLLRTLLLSILLLSACGLVPSASTPSTGSFSTPTPAFTPTSTPTPTPAIEVDPAQLRGIQLQFGHAFTGPAEVEMTSLVEQFNAANEWGITVTQVPYADYLTLFDSVSAALQDGSPPDVAASLPEQLLAWDASLVDLAPYAGDPAWGMAAGQWQAILPAFKAQDEVNGKRLGMPAGRSARFLFYNQSWGSELGFDAPPQTADEFKQQACAANASFRQDDDPRDDGYGGWILDTDWQTTYSWLLAFGGGAVDGSDYTFRTDPNLSALQFLKGLYDEACAWLSTEPNPFESFARRSALFISGNMQEMPLLEETMSRIGNADDWTVIPFPGVDGGTLVAYGPSYGVFDSTPEKQLAAWLFIRYLLAPENQAPWQQANGWFPLAEGDPSTAASPRWQAVLAAMPSIRGVPQLASWRTVKYVLEDGAWRIFRTDVSLEQIPAVLDEIDATAKDLGKP
jgi:multiple sugar transport system substrate-binding protein